MSRPLVVVLAATVAVGCGGDNAEDPSVQRPESAPAGRPEREPYELTCRDLGALAARREAIAFVADVLTAPPGQPRRRTLGIVRRSLQETCALPRLPDVSDPADYRPVKPVRQAVQNHFDQDAIYDP